MLVAENCLNAVIHGFDECSKGILRIENPIVRGAVRQIVLAMGISEVPRTGCQLRKEIILDTVCIYIAQIVRVIHVVTVNS